MEQITNSNTQQTVNLRVDLAHPRVDIVLGQWEIAARKALKLQSHWPKKGKTKTFF